jgi:CRISPR-associated protein Cas8a1/Csx13
MRTMPWSNRQKTRVQIVWPRAVNEQILEVYRTAMEILPAKLSRSTDGHAFVHVSALRAFVAENLARGKPWYSDFAAAREDTKDRALIHQRLFKQRPSKPTDWALFKMEREGLMKMTEHLDDVQQALVRSIHRALRQRFGAIAEECRGNKAAMENRWGREREHWRLRFSKAKTLELVRSALADLWSRAGTNPELQARWAELAALFSPSRWREVRDLALVALASYASEDRSESEGK